MGTNADVVAVAVAAAVAESHDESSHELLLISSFTQSGNETDAPFCYIGDETLVMPPDPVRVLPLFLQLKMSLLPENDRTRNDGSSCRSSRPP